MSAGHRIPLAQALAAANWLMGKWSMTEDNGCALVGSARRKSPTVGDLDLIAPLPPDDDHDALYDAIGTSMGLLTNKKGLFGGSATPGCVKGTVVKGFNPSFKSLQLRIVGASGKELPVQIERYHPGPSGNRGWKEIMRTGPAEFGEALLVQWKVICRTAGSPTPGSQKGFWVDENSLEIPTPTELHCFQRARCLMLTPETRHPDRLLCIDWLRTDAPTETLLRGQKALNALGLGHTEEAWDEWRLQTVALSTWKP